MDANEPTKKFWFPAKRYGWGWGFPVTPQGRLVLLGFVVLLTFGFVLFPPHMATAAFMIYTALLCFILVGICYLKGEPPSWRWGDKDK